MVAGLVVVATVVVVRTSLLRASTYTAALAEADAYERTYTEVLADPELAAVTEGLLGDLGVPPDLAVQARALTTSALRWAVPPSSLRQGTETVIDGALAYVRGDTDRLVADVDISDVLDRIDPTAVTEVRTLLAGAADRTATTVEEHRGAVQALAAELASGRVPDSVPVLGGAEYEPTAVIDVILDALGDRVDDELRLQVTAAVLADEQREALITAAAALVVDHARATADSLRADTIDGRTLDVVAVIAERAQRPADAVADSLGGTRRAARWFRPLTGVLAGVAAAVAAVAMVAGGGRAGRRGRAFLLAGATGAAALLTALLWRSVGRSLADPLDRATGTEPGSWGFPPGLRSVLADVREAAGQQVGATVLRSVLVLAGAGLAVAVATAVVTGLRRAPREGPVPRGRIAAAAGAAAVVVLGFGGGAVATPAPADDERLCNGHRELCARPYDEVVYAATHNAMSSPDVVAVWPEHDGDLRSQLDAGVRALLIDTHYWTPLPPAAELVALEPALPPALADVLVAAAAPFAEGRDGTFLCHNHCAFGGMPFLDGMVAVRQFLADNPHDVVTLIIQDAITPEDTAAVMRDAGLDGYLHPHGADDGWPTLGELVDRDERLVVFAEEAGPPPAWYANAFEAMQETPFHFLSAEELSCAPNRGPSDAPLFLMNHWVQRVAPDRVDALGVNRHDVLVERARRCEAERGLLPNYLAVNFYNLGDVVRAADTLNDLG